MTTSRLLPRAFMLWIVFCSGIEATSNRAAAAEVTPPVNPPTPAAERVGFQRTAVPSIPPGTRFAAQPPRGWSNLLSFARVKLTSGDVEAVSDTVRYYSQLFNLVMLANADKNAQDKFELDKVAIGFSMQIQGMDTIVTPETQADLGGKLSWIGRSVLAGNIDSLKNVQQVARTTHNIVIDAPATMLRDGKHREMVVRYYIWVFPENGNMGTLVWLLDPSPEATQFTVADNTIQLLPDNLHEQRVMNVDAKKFNLFGIPSKDAFALVQIPQGVTFEMNEKMRSLAAEKTYTPVTLAELTAAIAETLQKGRK